MKVAIIKYNAGNICSVINAMRRIGIEPVLSDNREELSNADRIIFPGQGEASNTLSFLREKGLDQIIKNLKQPVLGICIGQQLLCKNSEEGQTDCLNVFDGVTVRKFIPQQHEDKIPHMGWNSLSHLSSPLFKGIEEGEYVYFVHSYYVPVNKYTIAESNYIHPFSAAMHKGNFFSTQFHPEKSGKTGERILKNFIELDL